MLIKVYLKSEMFHLPIAHKELVRQVTEKLYKEMKLINSAIGKQYPILKVEGNENIIINKQRTNIFLLNFLLLVLYEQGGEIDEENHFSDSFIIECLEELTQLDLSQGYEDLEQKLLDYLANKSSHYEGESLIVDIAESTYDTDGIPTETNDTEDTFKNVKFSMDWVKQAHKKLEF